MDKRTPTAEGRLECGLRQQSPSYVEVVQVLSSGLAPALYLIQSDDYWPHEQAVRAFARLICSYVDLQERPERSRMLEVLSNDSGFMPEADAYDRRCRHLVSRSHNIFRTAM